MFYLDLFLAAMLVLAIVAVIFFASLVLRLQGSLERYQMANEHLESHNETLQVKTAELQWSLHNAYACLDLALNDIPTQFNDIQVEVGREGVIYQFASQFEDVVHA